VRQRPKRASPAEAESLSAFAKSDINGHDDSTQFLHRRNRIYVPGFKVGKVQPPYGKHYDDEHGK